ncbi:CCAAT/enhancer-binding protein zeta [Lepeophtheirus salmonis]|uniref:CCAAT/enhancer-binding protein zeta n=1 Tax=Lepeophtheirus salmonis TaxID=72036 RepID=UPI001AEAE027|nr:CCAAT/enhancer-binding protein zeta-like [Lepeophtheirus salmonis]
MNSSKKAKVTKTVPLKHEEEEDGEGEEAMDIDFTGDFKSEEDKKDWVELLKNSGLSNESSKSAPKSKHSKNEEKVVKKVKKSSKNKRKKLNSEEAEPESTTVQEEKEPNAVVNHGNLAFCKLSPPDRKFVLIKQNNVKWYELLNELCTEIVTNPSSSNIKEPLNDYWSDKMLKYATKLHQKEEEVFKNLSLKSSQYSWSEKILSSFNHGGGTLQDKLNVHTVRLQESPVHHFKSLEALIAHVNTKSRRPMNLCMDILTDLFISHLLVPGRKLKPFLKNPFRSIASCASPEKRDRLILLWYFESQLKEYYSSYLIALKEVSMDQIEKTRIDGMSKTLSLLIANPEMENILLEGLVNKLGDPVRSVASRAIYQLSTLLCKHHPAMKVIVVKEVERLLFRNNVNPKAQYYGICFLSQVMLSESKDEEIAKKMIQIYFSFFKSSIHKGEIDSKLMSGLLTGVNRAFPYAKDLMKDSDFEIHVETLYKVVHMSNFNISIQALSLLFQIDADKERYYSAIYKKSLDHDLVGSSKQAIFFNLIFKTLKADPEVIRVKAFVKRLLQCSSTFKPPLACAILFIVSEIIKARPELQLFSRELANFNMDVFDEEDEERYFDAVETSDGETNYEPEVNEVKENKSSSWVHTKNISSRPKTKEYNPFSRNPLYAGAEMSHLWELNYLNTHYHPSVSLFATNICCNTPISYSGDPLVDFTLIRFLDRFVFRNPKKQSSSSLSNKKHPMAKKDSTTEFVHPDDIEYIQTNESKIPNDELFIYKYLKKRADNKSKDVEEDTWDNDSVTSEEFDRYLDKMATDFGENDDIDFASDLSKEVKKPGKKKKKGDDSFDELEDDDEEESDMESEDQSNSESDSSELDEEGFDIEEEDGPAPKKKSGKKRSMSGVGGDSGFQSLLASAEEFAEMIENDETTLDAGGSQALSNKDNSGLKQLKWESGRSGNRPFKKRKDMIKRKRSKR